MPPPLAKKPINLKNVVTEDSVKKYEEEKLKSPKWLPVFSPLRHFNTYYIEHQRVFDAIKNRLASFNPPILLNEHIVNSRQKIEQLGRFYPIKTHRNVLNGIDFIIEDRNKFLCAVRNAKADGQKPAFVEGSNYDWKKHWALTLSFLATEGIGFREIFRPKMVERPIENPNNVRFDSRLGKDVTTDVSALHIAVAESK